MIPSFARWESLVNPPELLADLQQVVVALVCSFQGLNLLLFLCGLLLIFRLVVSCQGLRLSEFRQVRVLLKELFIGDHGVDPLKPLVKQFFDGGRLLRQLETKESQVASVMDRLAPLVRVKVLVGL